MNAPLPHSPAVRTTCPYCGVGCGVLAAPDGMGGAAIAGDPEHPANFGRLCSKGSALGETLSLDQRLLHPMLRCADGALARVSWDDALGRVAKGLRDIGERHGPGAIAFYLSGQLLTEDYYVANKLMKGFIGSANVDTNSRLCMSSSVAGHKRAFGADTVPGTYRDLDDADLIVLVGSNAAWCHPVLFQRMVAARRERGTKLVVIDPRRTATADEADLFLPIAPGMDTALFCGLLSHLADTRALNYTYIERHTKGFVEALARAREIAADAAATARAAGLKESDVTQFFKLFGKTERVVTCYSQGVNQSAQGTDKVNAIINVHLATGRIGRAGMGPFSLTGQPNAMGGREVGGLANQLAAHMGFSPAERDRVRRFWNAPRLVEAEGLKAIDMFDAIDRGDDQGAVGDGDQSGGIDAARRRGAGCAAQARALCRLRQCRQNRHDRCRRACSASRRRLGRERRHRHQFGAPDVAAARLPAASGRGAAGLVDRQRGRAPPRLRRRLRLSAGRPIFFANMRRFRHSRTTARAILISAASPRFRDDAYQGLDSVMWPVQAGKTRGEKRFFSGGGFFTDDHHAQFIAPEPPALARGDQRDLSAAPEHRPRARPVAHHDAHRQKPASGRPFLAALCRDQSGRRQHLRPSPMAALPRSRPGTALRSSRSS